MSTIVERIRTVFDNSGKTQSRIAKELNVTPAYIWKIKNNDEVTPSDMFIKALCDAYGISEGWIMNGTGEMFTKKGKEEEIADMVASLFAENEDSFKLRLIKALASMDKEGWDLLEKLADNVLARK